MISTLEPPFSACTTLRPAAFSLFPANAISPRGWLQSQLQIQARGLFAHLDEFWPSIAQSRWIGGQSEGWERGPYWLDALVPLAWLLDDAHLKAKAGHWVEAILASQHDDGWLGAKDDSHEGIGQSRLDPWPLFVLFKALLGWESATGDARIVPALTRCARRIFDLLQHEPLESWAQMRWMELNLSLQTLYEKTGESWLLELCDLAQSQGFDWREFYENEPPTERSRVVGWEDAAKLRLHGVNNAMALKSGAVAWRQSGLEADQNAPRAMLQILDEFHGQPTGMFSGDEHLAGREPFAGTETCTIVELLFSLETLLQLSGESFWADRLEKIAFNALPSALDETMWARQYDGQPNQICCCHAPHHFVSNGPDSNLFSLEGYFGCCTANFGQGWPKLAQNAFLQSENGVVAALLLPSRLQSEKWAIECETDYPFEGRATWKIEGDWPNDLEFSIRIPEIAIGATLQVGEEIFAVESGQFVRVPLGGAREVTLEFPLSIQSEARPNGAVSLHYGPLLLALPIPSSWTKTREIETEKRAGDWEARPLENWAFALDLESSSFEIGENGVSEIPFSRAHPAIEIEVELREVLNWETENDDALSPPPSPVLGEAQTRKLVPFGGTILRICEFPRVS